MTTSAQRQKATGWWISRIEWTDGDLTFTNKHNAQLIANVDAAIDAAEQSKADRGTMISAAAADVQ